MSRRLRFTRDGRRVPANVQLVARERSDGVQVATFSNTPSTSSRRRSFPPVERIEAMEAARDVRGLLTLRDAVLADLRDGTLHADDATAGGHLLAAIERALQRLAGGQETVHMSGRPRDRQKRKERPLSERVESARRALRGDHQGNTDADVHARVREAREALGL
jgi:hypothetical protein